MGNLVSGLPVWVVMSVWVCWLVRVRWVPSKTNSVCVWILADSDKFYLTITIGYSTKNFLNCESAGSV